MAVLDDCPPTAIEDHALGIRAFFTSEGERDEAARLVLDTTPDVSVTALLVPDENWAERSQASLHPIRAGRLVVAPPWTIDSLTPDADAIVITIQPSMGFGTGHHPSTRLCLQLLQQLIRPAMAVLDIGTGSGVLAIAACRLGAAHALGVDFDRDALTAAAENVERNGAATTVTLDVADITRDHDRLAGRFDLVFANITGAMLQRHASAVAATLTPGGILITSGFQTHERDDVAAAFEAVGLRGVEQADEDSWVALAFSRAR
jgi:ribosomal protein L11 methyltransferase